MWEHAPAAARPTRIRRAANGDLTPPALVAASVYSRLRRVAHRLRWWISADWRMRSVGRVTAHQRYELAGCIETRQHGVSWPIGGADLDRHGRARRDRQQGEPREEPQHPMRSARRGKRTSLLQTPGATFTPGSSLEFFDHALTERTVQHRPGWRRGRAVHHRPKNSYWRETTVRSTTALDDLRHLASAGWRLNDDERMMVRPGPT